MASTRDFSAMKKPFCALDFLVWCSRRIKKHITGQSGFKTEYDVSGSKADRLYQQEQSGVISQLLRDVTASVSAG